MPYPLSWTQNTQKIIIIIKIKITHFSPLVPLGDCYPSRVKRILWVTTTCPPAQILENRVAASRWILKWVGVSSHQIGATRTETDVRGWKTKNFDLEFCHFPRKKWLAWGPLGVRRWGHGLHVRPVGHPMSMSCLPWLASLLFI